MGHKLSVLLRSALIAYDELKREFGLPGALSILAEVGRRNAAGQPYKGVAPAVDAKDRETRAELAPAVNLYHVLRERLPEDAAFAVARRIILNSSLVHLRSIYPNFKGGDFLAMAGGDANNTNEMLNAEFAFADTKLVEMTKDRSAFDVVHCRIPAALALVDATRLGPIFCEVDGIYFPIYEPLVNLQRTETIIRGGKVCDFRLSWK